jgi:hypothetical protein
MTTLKLLPLAAGAAATALMVFSTPALADTPLAFDTSYPACDQTAAGPYEGSFECDIRWSGGTGTVTATFAPGNSSTSPIRVAWSSPGYAHVTGGCTTGRSASVIATLTDSTNASLSHGFSTGCLQTLP